KAARTLVQPVKTALFWLMLLVFINGCAALRPTQRQGSNLAAAQAAHKYIGTPYKYGGRSPRGFDCSGLTWYVYNLQNINLPPSSSKQSTYGQLIKKNKLAPGDLVFFRNTPKGRIGHVGIYIGQGKFIHAPGTGKKVTVASLEQDYFKRRYHSARRP
ncbi:MAG: C40 family peptidase, partial [Candidatus Adiutrix sp.]